MHDGIGAPNSMVALWNGVVRESMRSCLMWKNMPTCLMTSGMCSFAELHREAQSTSAANREEDWTGLCLFLHIFTVFIRQIL